MKIEIPILIPVKEHSLRCAKKNYALLPYTAEYIHTQGMADVAIVITDSENLMKLAASLGLNTFFEIRKPAQDELTSCYNYSEEKRIDLFFLCPATQPFRGEGLIKKMNTLFETGNQQRDFITTVSAVQDRSLFYVTETNNEYRFKTERKNRKGNDCPTRYMIDGALYLIKTSFLKKVIHAADANEAFWKGNFTCIKNEAPFMDIDTTEDMQQFEFLEKYFETKKAAVAV